MLALGAARSHPGAAAACRLPPPLPSPSTATTHRVLDLCAVCALADAFQLGRQGGALAPQLRHARGISKLAVQPPQAPQQHQQLAQQRGAHEAARQRRARGR